MQIKRRAQVLTASGEEVGKVDRVVLDPKTREVTHLVVQKGFLFTKDKVVPMDLVGPATGDTVTLWEGAGDLDKLPDFEETQYIEVNEEPAPELSSDHWAPPLYWYPPLMYMPANDWYDVPDTPHAVETTVTNVPDNTVPLETGAKVISRDDKHVGNIEQVFIDSETERATHLLIAEGLFLKEKKLIPIDWVSSTVEDKVQLAVDADFVNGLPEYAPRSQEETA